MRSKVTIAMVGAAAALTFSATGAAAATTANYVAGPYSSLSSCNSNRLTYVHSGGFSYVGSCYRQSNGRYYFQYR